jgi:phosphotransferase system HPr (HPr) family protein
VAVSSEIVVRHKVGLHARPAAQFVKTAARFKSSITVENLSRGTSPANAKSILSVLSAAVQMDDRIRLSAEGADESTAVAALRELIESNFGEPESH